jgi:hypothetical protein
VGFQIVTIEALGADRTGLPIPDEAPMTIAIRS